MFLLRCLRLDWFEGFPEIVLQLFRQHSNCTVKQSDRPSFSTDQTFEDFMVWNAVEVIWAGVNRAGWTVKLVGRSTLAENLDESASDRRLKILNARLASILHRLRVERFDVGNSAPEFPDCRSD